LSRIRELGAKAGVVLNPATSPSVVEEVLDLVDLVLVMSVNPGFGGQSFIPSAISKIVRVRAIIDQSLRQIDLQVDGGVNAEAAARCVAAGATALVAGNAAFKGGASAYAGNIAALRGT
jgi:ribulose-phosphate 3-epimerase